MKITVTQICINYPDDPKNVIPLNQIEFKQRVIRGPHQPDLEFYPRSSFSGAQHWFQKSWFKLFSWLEYSPKFDLAFCFPCCVFKNSYGIKMLVKQIGLVQILVIKIGNRLPSNLRLTKSLKYIKIV